MANFALQVAGFAKGIDTTYGKVIAKVLLDMYADIIKRTPVLTGRARASWNIGINRSDLSVASKAITKNGNVPQPNILEAASKLSDVTTKDTVFISNNLPYILELENGSSKQNRAGMVKPVVANFKRFVERAARI